MLYFYLTLLLIFLVMITVIFLRSLRSSEIPANAKLLIDAWNSIAKQ